MCKLMYINSCRVFQQSNKVFFVYGFAKNERANISVKQLKALA